MDTTAEYLEENDLPANLEELQNMTTNDAYEYA